MVLAAPAKADPDPLDVYPASHLTALDREVRSLLAALPDLLDPEALERAVIRRQPAAAAAAFNAALISSAPIATALLAALRSAGRREARGGTVIVKETTGTLSFAFDLADPNAVRIAGRQAADLVVEIGEATRQSIRALVVRAVAEGGHPYAVARQIRPLIGLHSRWATAVLNYRGRLEAAGTSLDRVEKLTASYYGRLLRLRSRNIARTEILRAANAGKAAGWRQAWERGYLGPNRPAKRWDASADSCPICAAVDGQEVPMDDEFSTSAGSFDMPPAHPSCRCTAYLVVDQQPQPSGHVEVIEGGV